MPKQDLVKFRTREDVSDDDIKAQHERKLRIL